MKQFYRLRSGPLFSLVYVTNGLLYGFFVFELVGLKVFGSYTSPSQIVASDQISFGSCALKRITDMSRKKSAHSDNISKLSIFKTVVIVQSLHVAQLSWHREYTRSWTSGVWYPAQAKVSSLLHSVQTGSGARSGSYRIGTGGCIPWGKAACAWRWPLTSIYCGCQEWWSYTFIPPYDFMA
jgi:hypothetical protein